MTPPAFRAALLLPLTLLALPFGPGPAAAQEARTAVVPQTITVGDVFHAAVRVELPGGARVEAPDTIALVEDVEAAGRMEVRLDSTAAGREATIVWPLAAWRPGEYQLPPVTVRLVRSGESSEIVTAFPTFTVSSVLPEDSAGLEPRPASDVLGANRVWWPIVLALLIALAIAVGLYLWWRSRRRAEPTTVVVAPAARVVALEQLRTLRDSGLLERGDIKAFHAMLTETLRRYAAAVDPSWGIDLTTAELSGRVRADLPVADALELVRILGAADLVKFARARPPAAAASDDLDAAIRWVERVGPAPDPATGGEPATPDPAMSEKVA